MGAPAVTPNITAFLSDDQRLQSVGFVNVALPSLVAVRTLKVRKSFAMIKSPVEAWEAAYHQLELQFEQDKFDTWVREARFLRYENGVFVIGVKSEIVRNMLQHRLYRAVARVVSDSWGQTAKLQFELARPVSTADKIDPNDPLPMFQLLAEYQAANPPMDTARPQDERAAMSAALPESPLNPRYTFDRYVVGSANRMAYEAMRAVAEAPGRNYNPLFVWGGVGVGKTHLLHAVGHVCHAAGKRVLYVSSEAFTNDVVSAVRSRTTAMLRDKYRSVDVLLMDDVQFIAGKETTQEEFFHTFEALHSAGKQIVIVSDRPPRELAHLEERLRSRFEGGLLVDVSPLELETRMAIVQMWMQEHHVRFASPVVTRLAQVARHSVRELEGAFNRLVLHHRASHHPITVEVVDRVLNRIDSARPNRTLAAVDVLRAVAIGFGVTIEDLQGKKRTAKISEARQIAMLLLRELTELPLSRIGDALGGRQHSTIISGVKRAQKALEIESGLRTLTQEIRAALVG
jgi:chromosomal replication initiator protein